ncbi:MAG: ABC transporter [Pelagibacterales bacterium]|nr:ABC transporter [Pelagibacterales bacterium]PPR15645.1 MAG: Aliphatic sulfonates import ATP-binding protein SsuB [Alphaproteobacteria bacterium MarineAlpha9_Bin3]|tara:strand:- start:15033 stop:15821 length:789 start_codon:yes stop_codon:yes gene_type:complete
MENNLKEKPLNTPHDLIVDILEKSYDNKSKSIRNNAIKNMKFNVPQGQFCCLVGPSGCGKTTLLNLLSGLDENLNGIIKYQDGSIPKDWPIGYMFQEPRLMPWLSVKQNVTIVTQQTSEEIELSENLINEMGLSKYMDSFPSELSGGMQRRVAIARAFVNKPKILLLDEPFISLDETVGNLLRQMLLKLWEQQKTTVIFVTHDLREAIYLSDRILFLSKGPSRIIHDFNININRPRKLNDKELDSLRIELISNHPEILSGKI